MTTNFDITIVGAGVIGLAVGATLAKLGKQVLILESRETLGQETKFPQQRCNPRWYIL